MKELLRDRSLDWFDRLMNGPWLDRGCWAVIGIAALYFGGLVCLSVLVG